MRLSINGEERELPDVGTIEELLRQLAIPSELGGIAVAQNDRVIPRARWGETPVRDGDRLEIIHAVQGG